MENLESLPFLLENYISSWIPIQNSNYFKFEILIDSQPQTCIILGFKNNEKLVFQGCISARLIQGSINVNASELLVNEWTSIYSCGTQGLLFFEASNSEFSIDYKTSINCKDSDQIQKILNSYPNVLQIISDTTGLIDIQNVLSTQNSIFQPRKYKIPQVSPDINICHEHNFRNFVSIPNFFPFWSLYTENNYKSGCIGSLVFPPQWTNYVEELKGSDGDKDLRIIVAGNKSSGKSTFARFLKNKLLNEPSAVYWLETDLGQPEMNVPGVIALHLLQNPNNLNIETVHITSTYKNIECVRAIGPQFINSANRKLENPVRTQTPSSSSTVLGSVYLGMVTPKENPELYINAISQMMNIYSDLIENVNGVLVVNTQGWTKGMGLDLLADVINLVLPSHYVQMCENSDTDLFFARQVFPTHTKIDMMTTVTGDYGLPHFSLLDTTSKTLDVVESSDSSDDTNSQLAHNKYGVSTYSKPNAKSRIHAHTIRNLSVVCHMYGKSPTGNWKFNVPLTHRLPIAIPFASVQIWICDNDIKQSQVLGLLNGSVVGVVAKYAEDTKKTRELEINNGWPDSNWEFCSLGIIKSVDSAKQIFYLLLAPNSFLRESNFIQLGFVKGPGPHENGIELPVETFIHGGVSDSVMRMNSTNTFESFFSDPLVVQKSNNLNDSPYLSIGTKKT
ncbi:hypothetical protein BB559_006609 [Furculomyces boomerangus]|uniref:Polynucleotide 5'-hydroxyl-kinase GRC3 n=1 Tax=Furculomyces boomerangus TaxID=61424 RepID=A0A2T9Y1K8_9FUNG|nr:hypothetical protein BB559_006609 [Furculomyces boomerangus]